MSKRFALFLLAIVVLFTALTRGEPIGPTRVEAKSDGALAQAAPYTRYPRFVQTGEGCGAGDGIAYDVTNPSKGGNAYSEMRFIFANGGDGCAVPVVYEDSPGWDCSTMGNLQCGPAHVADDVAVEAEEAAPIADTPAPIITPEPAVVTPEPIVIVIPHTQEEEDTCDGANPGNTKCVGNAGEDPNGRGTMVLDDPNQVNGEHGNQGQGGQNNKP